MLEHPDTRQKKINFAREIRERAVQEYTKARGEPIRSRNERALSESAFYTYTLNLRLEIEKSGGMDYRLLAERLWLKLYGARGSAESRPYNIFVNSMIARIHNEPVRDLLYPHVQTAMPELIKRYKDAIVHVSLWSQGDVSRTGRQVSKVENTNVVSQFMHAAAATTKRGADRRAFLEKTGYDVADDKFKNITDYAGQQLTKNPGRLKLVIIEDRVGNFGTVKERIQTELGAKAAERVDIVPIWAVYSHRGSEEKARETAEGREDAFAEKKRTYNAIESFDDLLDEGRFRGIFHGAHLFVDFDGVIVNDATMRQLQTDAIFSACIDGLSEAWKLPRKDTAMRINERLIESV